MSTPANKHTLNSLTQNSKDTISELENVFPSMMEIRTRLLTIGADKSDKKGSVLALFGSTEDLYVGSHFILHELMASLHLLIDSTTDYEKRYHIQNINLSVCEGHNYFTGNNGVWSLLKPMISALDNPILNSYVAIIDGELVKLGTEYCDKPMRNSTAHYDDPIKMYQIISGITEEDKYCKAISQYMLIHSHISQISTIIFAIISQFAPKKTVASNIQIKPTFDIKAFLEDKLAEEISSDNRLIDLSGKSLMNISKNIKVLYTDHLKYEKLKEYLTTNNIASPLNAEIIHQLILLRMMVAFIRCDLTCSISAYLNSKSGVERALHLRKIFLTEVSALTHLYGYNQEKKSQSLWRQLMEIDNDNHDNKSASLQEEFEALTSHLDNVRRNLYTHFREGKELNIQKRYTAYKGLNQVTEIKEALRLINLCKDIEDYTKSVLMRVRQNEQQKSKEQQNSFNSMCENIRTKIKDSKSSAEMEKANKMIDEMERKITGFFDSKKE